MPFSIFTVVIDKTQLNHIKGLQYKSSFYKFCNNIMHKELRRPYTKLTIVADEIGGSEYMKSFTKYVGVRQDAASLLGEANFMFQNSQNNVLIQLADLIAGTYACEYDMHKKTANTPLYHNLLKRKSVRIEFYPKSFQTYVLDNSALAENYDKEIATLCFKLAVDFVHQYEDNFEPERQYQIIIVQYLLFCLMNNTSQAYISTRELKGQQTALNFQMFQHRRLD